jgi:hypothetical protein
MEDRIYDHGATRMTVRVVYRNNPPDFPATSQHPNAVRYGPYNISGVSYWADAIDTEPTLEEVAAIIAPPPSSFLPRDLLALLTTTDLAAIKTAVDADVALYGLWCSLLVQGEAPISTASPRFQAGWVGLSTALGTARADELATALGIA